MSKAELAYEIESLRMQMVNSYLEDDLENALRLSQELDQTIYRYVLISTQGNQGKAPA